MSNLNSSSSSSLMNKSIGKLEVVADIENPLFPGGSQEEDIFFGLSLRSTRSVSDPSPPGGRNSSEMEGKKDKDSLRCQYCGQKGYKNQLSLRQHIYSLHASMLKLDKLYSCKYCKKGYTYPTSLKKHIKKEHKEVYRCKPCGKQFKDKGCLLQHLQTRSHLMVIALQKSSENNNKNLVGDLLEDVDEEPQKFRRRGRPPGRPRKELVTASSAVSSGSASKDSRVPSTSRNQAVQEVSRNEENQATQAPSRLSSIKTDVPPQVTEKKEKVVADPADVPPPVLERKEQVVVDHVSSSFFMDQTPVFYGMMFPPNCGSSFFGNGMFQMPSMSYPLPFQPMGVPRLNGANFGLSTSGTGNGNVQCSKCPANFFFDNELRRHIQSCHPQSCWKCPVCQEVMLTPAEFKQHFAANHPSA